MKKLKSKEFPLFVVAGMPRGGTTFLYHYLSKHPDIFLPYRKEVNYFNVNFFRGVSWYRRLFSEMDKEMIAGDISPPCFLHDASIEKIKTFSNDTKIILIIRDPVEWAVSFYHQFKTFNSNVPPLEEYLNNGYSFNVGKEYIQVDFYDGCIINRINEYIQAFGDNLLVYDFASFKSSPLEALGTIESFLNISPHFNKDNFTNERINESSRRNITFLSWILSREWLISCIGCLFSRKIIMNVRAVFDKYSTKTNGEQSKNKTHIKDELELAKKYLSKESVKVSELFNGKKYFIGNNVK